MTEGRVRRAYLGIAGGPRPLPPRLSRETGRETAVEVVEVVGDSPAGWAGLRAEDIILEIDGTPVLGMDDLQRLMDGNAVGRQVAVLVHRNGRTVTIPITPEELGS
jgi:S1-C subfamily serine protease